MIMLALVSVTFFNGSDDIPAQFGSKKQLIEFYQQFESKQFQLASDVTIDCDSFGTDGLLSLHFRIKRRIDGIIVDKEIYRGGFERQVTVETSKYAFHATAKHSRHEQLTLVAMTRTNRTPDKFYTSAESYLRKSYSPIAGLTLVQLLQRDLPYSLKREGKLLCLTFSEISLDKGTLRPLTMFIDPLEGSILRVERSTYPSSTKAQEFEMRRETRSFQKQPNGMLMLAELVDEFKTNGQTQYSNRTMKTFRFVGQGPAKTELAPEYYGLQLK